MASLYSLYTVLSL